MRMKNEEELSYYVMSSSLTSYDFVKARRLAEERGVKFKMVQTSSSHVSQSRYLCFENHHSCA